MGRENSIKRREGKLKQGDGRERGRRKGFV